MLRPGLPHPGRVEHHDENGAPAGETSFDRRPDTDRFAATVRAPACQDPRFVRRVTAPATGDLAVGDLMLVLALR